MKSLYGVLGFKGEKVLQLDMFREIIVDNFAGGGGASTGIEMATGLSVDIAINHDPAAIAMHKLNHPDTEHYCESAWDVDPVEAVRGRKVGLAWFSPDCTHHSKAKGGQPVKQEIRGLAWIAVKWALTVKPRVIMLENVEEFQDWGPIEGGKPVKEMKGVTFNSFVKALESLGYKVEFRALMACDYGAPTIRKRFFMIARCDGKPITWPAPTHGDPQSPAVQLSKLKPWRAASEIIDWSIGAPSIFARKKPLVPNTLKRIQRGLERFVINTAEPFMVPDEHKAAFLISYYTEQSEKEVRGLSLASPLHTITAGGNRFGLVTAFLTKYYGQSTAQGLSEPLHTITTKDRFALTAIKSNGYQITDIGLRMLQPHELFAGQGFPTEYMHPGTKSEQIKRVGNSVPPPFADALVRANLPEMSVDNSRYKVAAGEY